MFHSNRLLLSHLSLVNKFRARIWHPLRSSGEHAEVWLKRSLDHCSEVDRRQFCCTAPGFDNACHTSPKHQTFSANGKGVRKPTVLQNPLQRPHKWQTPLGFLSQVSITVLTSVSTGMCKNTYLYLLLCSVIWLWPHPTAHVRLLVSFICSSQWFGPVL